MGEKEPDFRLIWGKINARIVFANE